MREYIPTNCVIVGGKKASFIDVVFMGACGSLTVEMVPDFAPIYC